MPKKDEIEKMAEKLYESVYYGHIPWEHWRKLAAFVLHEKKLSYEEGRARCQPEHD